jgi:hypothetical protein
MSPESSRQEMEAGALQLSVAPWAAVTLWSGASPISASYSLARCSPAIALLNLSLVRSVPIANSPDSRKKILAALSSRGSSQVRVTHEFGGNNVYMLIVYG